MKWKTIKFGDLFTQYRIEHIVQDNIDYGQITISKNGYIKYRTTKNGKDIGRKRQFLIDLEKYPNTLLFTRQGVAEGAIAFAPKEVNGCIVTENMPMFSLKDSVDKKFVELLLKSEQYISAVKKLIPTGSAQKSIHERDLMQISLTVPSKEEQKKISSLIENYFHKINMLSNEIQTQQTLLKQLRQSILQEAIEGKLTISWREKNPNIESATILLEKIKAEKERLIKEKKIKKQKALAPIDKSEVPFDIPNGWVWCRLGEIAYGFQYGTSSKSLKDGLIPVLRMGNIQNGLVVMNNFVYSNNKNDLEKYSLLYNDLLFNRTNSKELVGKTAIYNFKETAIYAGYLIRFRMLGKVSPNYINYLMNSQLHRNWCNKVKSDAIGQSNINATKLKSYLVPLPPFKEQKQIVQKIETLFSLCDKLEEQINASKKSSEMLMQSVLKEAFGE